MTQKNILITGATDGIGLETAKLLAPEGHKLIIHGRNPEKLKATREQLSAMQGCGEIDTYESDFSILENAEIFARALLSDYQKIDVVINNAGVYKTKTPRTQDGLDLRFAVNTFAPYILTKRLLPIIPANGRIVNLSSAAQAPVNISALAGKAELGDMPAYAQSKLALTMVTRVMAKSHPDGPAFFAVNPGSLLNTNMVKAGWGGSDNDVGIGADILVRAALSDEFTGHSGDYFDNDSGRFSAPHVDALDTQKCADVVAAIETTLNTL